MFQSRVICKPTWWLLSTMGHRGIAATLSMVTERFWWPDMREAVRYFYQSVYPLQELQWDCPFWLLVYAQILPASYQGRFPQHMWCCATQRAPVPRLLSIRWCIDFPFSAIHKCFYQWSSRQASHFKNTVMTELTERYAIAHHFKTPYCPWANGSVERANRDILKVFRVMLSEYRMDVNRSSELISLVQFSLNNLPRRNLAMHAPIAVMTGLPRMSPLEDFFSKKSGFYGKDTQI